MALENSTQDLNYPVAVNRNQLKKKRRVQKLLLDLIVIGSILLSVFLIFNIRLINPPIPGGFP